MTLVAFRVDATLYGRRKFNVPMDDKRKLAWTKPELRKLKLTPELLELLGPDAQRLMAEEIERAK